jgi:hypothetical protein
MEVIVAHGPCPACGRLGYGYNPFRGVRLCPWRDCHYREGDYIRPVPSELSAYRA